MLIDIADMRPGDFTWHPERSPSGAVAVVVSLTEQRVHVYRNGIRIAVSTCSSGKPGHETPTGVFTVLQKDRHHKSSTYNQAPMPNMNRLTWDGIALHAGNLPGYPASHGCVRLPMAFSEKLYSVTHIGTPVIVAGSISEGWGLTHPGLMLGESAEQEMALAVDALNQKSHPADWSDVPDYPVLSILVTGADRQIALIEDGVRTMQSNLVLAGSAPLREHVFLLQGADEHGFHWTGVTHHADPDHPLQPEEAVLDRIGTDSSFMRHLYHRLHPGAVMIVSDAASHPDSMSSRDFVIMSQEEAHVLPPRQRPDRITDQG